MKDIATREDIELLIDRFYEKVRDDQKIGPHFKDVDWAVHTPVIVDFWCMVLLGHPVYKSNPFQKHLKLSLDPEDFQIWLKHFGATVDAHFEGPVAREAKDRAHSIAGIFQSKLGLFGGRPS